MPEQPDLKRFPEFQRILITVFRLRSAGLQNDFLKFFIAVHRIRQLLTGYSFLIGDLDLHPALHLSALFQERQFSPVQQYIHDHAERINIRGLIILPGTHEFRSIPCKERPDLPVREYAGPLIDPGIRQLVGTFAVPQNI